MNFEEFVETVKGNILDHLPASYAGAKVDVTTREKVNRTVTSISVVPEGVDSAIVPTISLNGAYERFQKNGHISDIVEELADTVIRGYQDIETNKAKEDPMSQMDANMVFLQLINTDSNRSLLENVPHREFNDMSVIYRVLFDKSEDGIQSVMVTHDLAHMMGMTEDDLFERASEQTKELFPVRITPMSEVLRGFMGDMGVDDDVFEEMGMESPLYLVTNDMGVHGASYMVYDDVLQDVSNQVGDNVYVLPSSIHEFLAVPESMCDPEELSDMVTSINRDTVNQEDRLSNQVFFYDRQKRELTQVSDVPIKGILDEDFTKANTQSLPFTAPTPALAMAAR